MFASGFIFSTLWNATLVWEAAKMALAVPPNVNCSFYSLLDPLLVVFSAISSISCLLEK